MRVHIATLILCLAAARAAANVEIVAPREILHDDDLRVRVTGLESGTTVELRSEFVTPGGTIWRSDAMFVADANGNVDPSTMAPVSGSWSEADPHAFIWSMAKTNEMPSTASVLENDDRSIITVAVLQNGKNLAEKRITLWKRAAGISTTEIRGPVIGTLYEPYGKRSLPGIIVLGGSEGGVNRWMAALLASRGFATLAVAYFGIDPLPDLLDRIPVESIDRAVEWLRAQPAVDPKKIAIVGGSKGAELALVAASRNPAVRAVVAYAPSSVVFQSITYGKGGKTSSWTAGGKELPFAPYVDTGAYAASKRLIDLYEPTLTAAPADAAIPVETINGPILLIAGKEDALWPSATMAAQIVARAKEHHFRFPITNLTIDDAGHHVLQIPNRPTGDSLRLGGSAKGLFDAQSRSWRAMIDFLDHSLR
ncbi:MAG TPA: acyl-CoA thioesterase/bile acid-CoA:amino acid N-acyltransferase family protein [Vicinamibacterales bacterium]|nr:acyl-CoA thioesterase/bile acid-CoA:amino acid N-acyltransferase family protein [Vicinamibacterales bacterium]